MAGNRLKAVIALRRAFRDHQVGRPADAWLSLTKGLGLLDKMPTSNQKFMDTAKTYHLGAQIKISLGEIEYGLDLFARAEEIFAETFRRPQGIRRMLV